MQQRSKVWGLIGTSALGIIFLAQFGGDVTSEVQASPTGERVEAAEPFALECGPTGASNSPNTAAAPAGDPAMRESAQRGLNFLSHATVAWQEQNNCFGCHVQGVTGEAFAVGLDNDYTLPEGGMQTVLDGMLTANGGLRTTTGHAAPSGYLRFSSRAFGGAALARYDALVSDRYSDDLFVAAKDLLEYQHENGDMTGAYNHGVVAQGDIQATYQAIQTWNQAYQRSADDQWRTAVQKAEKSMQRRANALLDQPEARIQQVNYAILGLLEAGVGGTETTMVALRDRLLAAQLSDGSWPKRPTQDSTSSTLVTGQTLYTLRRLGMNDGDEPIRKGISYLMKAQQEDGGWSDSGSEKAEAMWAVLGLVATDVLSVDVDGLVSGQRVEGQRKVAVRASDNEGAGVHKIEVFVDDIRVAGACDASLDWSWDTSDLETGKHLVDIVATNASGKESRRRFVTYAGDVFVTGLGTRFENVGTRITARNIAPTSFTHTLAIEVFEANDDGSAGTKISSTSLAGAQGPVDFVWDGTNTDVKKAQGGEYLARISVVDSSGKARQTVETPFVHATYEYQKENYAQASGSLSFADDEVAANAEVELVDEDGNVVQRTRSTASGEWRFRNVKADKAYKVRVKKKGFQAKEAELAPRKGEAPRIQMMLE